MLALSVFLLSFSNIAMAQLTTATMVGSVTDSTGAVIPHATITVTQTDTNFTRTVTAKDDGSFRDEFLPVGPYKISVSAPGFKTLQRTGVVLSVMQEADLTFQLQNGETTETVNVSSGAPLINLSNATIGRTISNVEIENLPLVGRDTYQLLSLTPGVQSNSTQNSLGFKEQHVYINGSTDDFTGQVSYYLDGGLNMTGLRNSGNAVPTPDAISQFHVETNNFSATLGRYAAAVVSLVTKDGTNQFHGSAFEFYRTKNFTAVSHNQITKQPYARNEYGATFGGPIRKNKDFFFGSFGGLRATTSSAFSGNVPDAAQLSGNFSENLPSATEQANCATSPSSSASKAFHFLVCNPATNTPYPGNIITTPLDPTAVKIVQYLNSQGIKPGVGAGQFGDNQYTYREYDPTPEMYNQYLIKTDHQVTPNHRLTLSYFLYDYSIRSNPGGLTPSHWSFSNYATKQQNANISDTWTVNERTVNQAWLSYTRQAGGRIPVPSNSTFADFGSDFGISGSPSRGQVSIPTWFTLSQAITGPKAGTNLYAFRDLISTSRGKHTLSLGAETSLEKDFQLTSLDNYGVFSYATTKSVRTTNSLSDYLLGLPNTFEQDTGEYAEANYWNFALFAQDDWRILPNLTVNLGLRYDWQQAPTDTQNRQTNFIPGVQSHAFKTVNIAGKTGPQLAPIGMLFPGDPGVPTTGAFTPSSHISPRIGLSYDPYGNGKTVFHAAGGLFYGGISGNLWELPSNFAPYAVRPTFSKVVSMAHPYSNDPTEFPGGVNPFPTLTFTPHTSTASFLALNQVSSFDSHFEWPVTYQINAGIQQELGNGLALSINYVASLNRKLPIYHDLNPPQFNITASGTSGPSCTDKTKACAYANTSSTVNNRRPLNSEFGLSAATPTYSNVYNLQSSQNSNYNGLQVSLEKRLSHNFSARGHYIWSKTLASNALDGSNLAATFVDPNYPQLEAHQRSDQDRRNMVTASFVWTPDYFTSYNRYVRTALNGWTVTGIITMNSGQPFTVTTGTDVNGDGQTNDRPSVLPGRTPHTLGGKRSRLVEEGQWFDTSVYCIPGTAGCPGVGPLGLLGNTRPAQLDDPGYRDVDASLFRTFGIFESLKFQLRGEVTNVFNLTNLGTPSTAMNSSTFGEVTGSGGSNRIIQVGGRILF
ncbi:Oar protein [Edaphobacter dinghuensis]|uniref:Oar protein n=2 Tax=Edaphobacter dinghuensis TaxID=1560005 RepID=A0A917M2W2_9BACT|nr:Oar protein [Edaphobacter dinghuensis]